MRLSWMLHIPTVDATHFHQVIPSTMDIGLPLAKCIGVGCDLRDCLVGLEKDCTFSAFEKCLRVLVKLRAHPDFEELVACREQVASLASDGSSAAQGLFILSLCSCVIFGVDAFFGADSV